MPLASHGLLTNTKSLHSTVLAGKGVTDEKTFVERALSSIQAAVVACPAATSIAAFIVERKRKAGTTADASLFATIAARAPHERVTLVRRGLGKSNAARKATPRAAAPAECLTLAEGWSSPDIPHWQES
jgi:hypothetical protein